MLERSDLSFFAGKTFLITGAYGMIAQYIVRLLLAYNKKATANEKITVIALVRDLEKAQRIFSSSSKDENLKIIKHDLRSPLDTGNIFADYIIHAASLASPKFFAVDPVGIFEANVIGTLNLLNYAHLAKTRRLLFISSAEVYGIPAKNPVTEFDFGPLDPLSVRSCYAESKRMAENLLVSWGMQYGIESVIARPFHTYGPTMNLDDGRVFADFVANIVKANNLLIKGTGKDVRSYCYVADAVCGLISILKDGTAFNAYNLGNSRECVSVENLADILVSLFPERELKVCFDKRKAEEAYLPSPVSTIIPDTTKLIALGWEPVYSIQEGFFRTIKGVEQFVLQTKK